MDRTVLALLLAGALLLPAPGYAIGLERLDEPEPTRSPTGYVATEFPADNDTAMVSRYGSTVSFDLEDLQYRHVADEYEAPNRTRRTVRRAIVNGSAAVERDAVERDVDQLTDRHQFVGYRPEGADERRYYEVELGTVDGTTTVTASRASTSAVADAARAAVVVSYESLSAGERRTFEKIRDATTRDGYGAYRPWSNESMVETPAVVERDGTHYRVYGRMHVDDIAFPDGLFVGLVGSAVGLVALVAGGSLGLYRWYRARNRGGSGD